MKRKNQTKAKGEQSEGMTNCTAIFYKQCSKIKTVTLLIVTITMHLWLSPQDASCGELYKLIPLRDPLVKSAEFIIYYELFIENAVIYKYNATLYFATDVINNVSSCELRGKQVKDWACIHITDITDPLVIEEVNGKKIKIKLTFHWF